MPYGYLIEYDVSLAAIGEGIARNYYGAFATKADAERWLSDQGGMAGKNPKIRRQNSPGNAAFATWNKTPTMDV